MYLSDFLVHLPLFRPQLSVPLFEPLLRRGAIDVPVNALEHDDPLSTFVRPLVGKYGMKGGRKGCVRRVGSDAPT